MEGDEAIETKISLFGSSSLKLVELNVTICSLSSETMIELSEQTESEQMLKFLGS